MVADSILAARPDVRDSRLQNPIEEIQNMPDTSRPWVADLLARAADIRPCCDGACSRVVFLREEFTALGMRKAGLSTPSDVRRHGWSRAVRELSDGEYRTYMNALCDGLRALSEDDLEPTDEFSASSAGRGRGGLGILLKSFRDVCSHAGESSAILLGDSWAGNEFSETRARLEAFRTKAEETYEKERQEVLLRRQERALRIARAHEQRTAESTERGRARADYVNRFRNMLPVERLRALASNDFDFPIDAIPADLIPSGPDEIASLGPDERCELLVRLDRRTSSRWRALRDQLHQISSPLP